MDHKPLKIIEIKDEGRNVKTFSFDEEVHTSPGTFVTAWIPEYGEKPFSVSYENPFGITAKRIERDPSNPMAGRFTNKLFELKEGDTIWISGPKGKGFPTNVLNNSKVCIVAGGTGAASVASLSEKHYGSRKKIFMGAKTVDDLIMEDRFFGDLHITTEDGSKGEKGLVTDALKKYEFPPKTKAAICGPEKMMYKAAEILEQYIPPENIYISVERLMKCGDGLCGSCDFGGYRPCVDGPVFTYSRIKNVPDFGKFRRDRCGRKEFL